MIKPLKGKWTEKNSIKEWQLNSPSGQSRRSGSWWSPQKCVKHQTGWKVVIWGRSRVDSRGIKLGAAWRRAGPKHHPGIQHSSRLWSDLFPSHTQTETSCTHDHYQIAAKTDPCVRVPEEEVTVGRPDSERDPPGTELQSALGHH